ncbi:hypothetical protein Leryth_010011 [Lithospermum erythrorhizon]|nr:hypothetical protein Leryth_010011 [Lithospermum erythrorhizon]
MAFSNEGFSVREYTWRMRSEDVVKCWPFDDITTYDERKMKSFLPQITVKKFRWWFDELQFAISPSNRKVKRKKGLKRNGSVIEEAEELDDDRVTSKKVKAPKRRHVVELFEVSQPPVETVHEEEAQFDDDTIASIGVCDTYHDDKVEGIPNFESLVSKNANFDMKEKNNKREHPESRRLCKKKFKKDKKQLNIKENGLMKFHIAKKKRPYKSIVHSPVHPPASSSSLFDKQLDEDSMGAGSCAKKKPQRKSIVKGKKGKVIRASKLFSDCLKPDSHPQCIVGKDLFYQSSITHVLLKTSKKHQSGTLQSKKDDLIGKLREDSSAVRCPELQEVIRVNSSDVSLPKDCVQGTTEDENSWVTNVTRAISRKTEVDLSFEPIIEKHLCEMEHSPDDVNIIRDSSNFLENSFNRYQGSFVTKEHCGAGPAMSLGDYRQQVSFQLPGTASFAPNNCRIFGALSENNVPKANELYLKEYATAPLQSSWLSTLDGNAAHPQFVPEDRTRNFRAKFIPCYPIPRLTPKELMHTICSPLNLKQKEIMHGEILMQDFVGLPLNSQGELIKKHSKSPTVPAQLKTASTIACNFTSLGAPTDILSCRAKFPDVKTANCRRPLKGQLNVFPNKDFKLQNPYIAMSSGLVNLDPVDGDPDSHSNYSFESDLEQMTIPTNSQKLKHANNLHIQKTSSSCQLQSTMCLMGKVFPVGEMNLQQLEDRKVWTDKLGTTENSTTRVLRGTGASSKYLADKELAPRQSLFCRNGEADIVEQYGFGSVRRYLSPCYMPSFFQAPSHPFEKHGFVIQDSAKCQYPFLSSHSLSSTNNNLGRRMSSINGKLTEIGPPATSALGLPVLHSRLTQSLGTPQSICPSWSGDTEKREIMDCLPSFPDSLRIYYTESGTSANLLNDPSLEKPTVNCLSSSCFLRKSFVQHASSHYHLIPSIPLSTLDQATHNIHRNKMKSKRHDKLRTSARGPDICKITNKWTPMLLEDSTSQFHNLSLLEDPGDTVKPAQKDSEVDAHRDNREDESCSFNDQEKAKAGDQVGSNEIVGSSELVSGETNDRARTGPVKLAAGGKHILKPSKKASQIDNSSPTSSTIRFVETLRAKNVLQSDDKPARIYKF